MKPVKITKGRFKGMTVVSAPTQRVDRLHKAVDRVLEALGHPQAYVTDESSVSDFDPTRQELAAAARELGISLKRKELIADVAERLMGGH